MTGGPSSQIPLYIGKIGHRSECPLITECVLSSECPLKTGLTAVDIGRYIDVS